MKKRTLALLLVLVLLVGAMLAVWMHFSPKATSGEKSITVEVTHADGTVKSLELQTSEEFLAPALEEENFISGEEGEYGLFITTVDGEYADPAQSQWWVFTVNGEMGDYGADSQPITEGDVYAFSIYEG